MSTGTHTAARGTSTIQISDAFRETHGPSDFDCTTFANHFDSKWAVKQAKKTARYRDRSTEELAAARLMSHPDGFKKCRTCGPRQLADFAGNRSQWDNCQVNCRSCDSSRKKRAKTMEPGKMCEYFGSHAASTQDHIWPVAMGGADADWNIAWVCEDCNKAKRDIHPLIWFSQVGIDTNKWIKRIGVSIAGPVALAA